MKAFASYHPSVLFLYFVCIITVSMFINNPITLCLSLLGGILFCLMLQRRSEIPGNIGFYVPLFLIIALTNPLFSHNGVTPLFFLNGNPVTLEAFAYGAAFAAAAVGVILWCKCYSEIMTSDKFLYLFSAAVPKLALVISSALRFIPLFKRQLKKVNAAQKAMGLYSSKSIPDRIKSCGRVFLAMVSWSLESAVETSMSMKARGYGTARRSNFSVFRFKERDGVLLMICALLFFTVLFGSSSGILNFYYYPEISKLSLSTPAVIIYTVFGTLSFLPFMIEVKEAAVWKYCVSKI